MIIRDIHIESTEWTTWRDSWITPEAIEVSFFYPTKNNTSVKGSLEIPWKKAQNMSLGELDKYVKRNVLKTVKELEE